MPGTLHWTSVCVPRSQDTKQRREWPGCGKDKTWGSPGWKAGGGETEWWAGGRPKEPTLLTKQLHPILQAELGRPKLPQSEGTNSGAGGRGTQQPWTAGQGHGPGVGLTRLPLHVTSCVILSSELNLSGPQFPHLKKNPRAQSQHLSPEVTKRPEV